MAKIGTTFHLFFKPTLALLVVKFGTTILNFPPETTPALTTSAPSGENWNCVSESPEYDYLQLWSFSNSDEGVFEMFLRNLFYDCFTSKIEIKNHLWWKWTSFWRSAWKYLAFDTHIGNVRIFGIFIWQHCIKPWLYKCASVRTIDKFSVYWSNKQNELDEVDETDELNEVDELDEGESLSNSWMKYFIFKKCSTSFVHQSEVVHEWTTHHYLHE